MKRTLAALVLGALAIFAVGCGTDPIERGVIKHKSYDDPDEWEENGSCLMRANGKIVVNPMEYSATPCLVYNRVTRYDGPHWEFYLYDSREDREGWVEVTEREFDAYKVGDWYKVRR